MAPGMDPLTIGVNVTLIVQFWPGARVTLEHESVSEYPPLAATEFTVRLIAPVLVTVIFWTELDVFRTWLPKARLDGDKDIAEVAPVPVRVAVCGLLLASSVTVSVPVRVPVVDGVKKTLIVHVPLGGTGCWQVLVWVKSPPAEMPRMLRATV